MLCSQPLEAINQQFFSSNDGIVVEDVIDLLEIYLEHEVDEISMENYKMFITQTLPQALKSLAKKDPSFLVNFIFFATGSRCIPQCNGIPSFKLKILPDLESDDNLPSSHTCENLIHVPWGVYDNNVEVLMKKLEFSVGHASIAGFEMN